MRVRVNGKCCDLFHCRFGFLVLLGGDPIRCHGEVAAVEGPRLHQVHIDPLQEVSVLLVDTTEEEAP